ncbi:Pyrroline-5-carboxylate reductase-like protein [Drosera capensis]
MTAVTPIPAETYKLGLIGAGKLAESIARGVVDSGILPPSRISTGHSSEGRRKEFGSFGVSVFEHNHQGKLQKSIERQMELEDEVKFLRELIEEQEMIFTISPTRTIRILTLLRSE